jgi:hypothetical protein
MTCLTSLLQAYTSTSKPATNSHGSGSTAQARHAIDALGPALPLLWQRTRQRKAFKGCDAKEPITTAYAERGQHQWTWRGPRFWAEAGRAGRPVCLAVSVPCYFCRISTLCPPLNTNNAGRVTWRPLFPTVPEQTGALLACCRSIDTAPRKSLPCIAGVRLQGHGSHIPPSVSNYHRADICMENWGIRQFCLSRPCLTLHGKYRKDPFASTTCVNLLPLPNTHMRHSAFELMKPMGPGMSAEMPRQHPTVLPRIHHPPQKGSPSRMWTKHTMTISTSSDSSPSRLEFHVPSSNSELLISTCINYRSK